MDQTRVIEVNSQKARLLEQGTGEAVVVLHGWGGRIESMAPVISCLSRSARVVALDLPGFGESPTPSGVWGTPDYAEFVRDVLGTLRIDGAAFVGHSFGAKTSLYLAATHRDLVRKLVAQGASGLRSAPSMKARLKRTLSKAARFAGALGPPGRALRRAVYDRIASQDYRDAGDMRPIFVKIVNEDIGHLLPSITAPSLLVWGTEDDAAPLAHGKRMERLIPDAGLVTFEGAGHFAYLDEPDRFCTIVRHFLEAGD
ncbi:MAG: alpha/beta fold hydrolase [Actinomycetota bacterium]